MPWGYSIRFIISLYLHFLSLFLKSFFAQNYTISSIPHHHHHDHVMPLARISLTLSRHFSLSFIPSGRSSGLPPVSSHSCFMYVLAGRPAFARPFWGPYEYITYEFVSASPVVSCQPGICPRKWDARTSLWFRDTNGSPNLGQITTLSDCHKKKKKKRNRTFWTVDFAVPTDHNVNRKEKQEER